MIITNLRSTRPYNGATKFMLYFDRHTRVMIKVTR